MDILWILAEQIGLFVIYIVVGILMVQTRVLTRDTLETISRFVMKLSMPVMIFTTTVGGVDRSSLVRSFPLLGLTAALYVCTFCLGKLLVAGFRLQGGPGPGLPGAVHVRQRGLHGYSHHLQHLPRLRHAVHCRLHHR